MSSSTSSRRVLASYIPLLWFILTFSDLWYAQNNINGLQISSEQVVKFIIFMTAWWMNMTNISISRTLIGMGESVLISEVSGFQKL